MSNRRSGDGGGKRRRQDAGESPGVTTWRVKDRRPHPRALEASVTICTSKQCLGPAALAASCGRTAESHHGGGMFLATGLGARMRGEGPCSLPTERALLP